MGSKITVPYTYLLRCKPINMYYYGVEWKSGCHPSKFWKSYFTSSHKLVPLLRTLFGDDAFEFEIRRTFSTIETARDWESKVLRRMKVLQNQTVWLNKTNNKAILNGKRPDHSQRMMGKNNPSFGVSPKCKGTNWYNDGENEVMGHCAPKGFCKGRLTKNAGENNGMFGKQQSKEFKQFMSKRMKDLIWITNGLVSKRIEKQQEIPFGWKQGRATSWQ